MARKTKAEQAAEYQAYADAKLAEQVVEYPQRLMSVLARATNAYFELAVSDNKFLVKTRNEYKEKVFALAYAHSPNSQEQLDDLEWDLERYEQELAEQKRLREVKASALKKVNELLTEEERELLGL